MTAYWFSVLTPGEKNPANDGFCRLNLLTSNFQSASKAAFSIFNASPFHLIPYFMPLHGQVKTATAPRVRPDYTDFSNLKRTGHATDVERKTGFGHRG